MNFKVRRRHQGISLKRPPLVGDFRDSKGGGLSSVGLSCNKTKWNRVIFPKTRGGLSKGGSSEWTPLICNIILKFLWHKFRLTIFAVRSFLRLFKDPLKTLRKDRTAKMVGRNFCHKKFKILLEMCSADLTVYPESILNVRTGSQDNI